MNEHSSGRRLRDEFEKPPAPELKPKENLRYSPEKRMLPGRPTFGGSASVPPVKVNPPKKIDLKEAQRAELRKQISLEEIKFQARQKHELQQRKKYLSEEQAPERFDIQNEKAEIAKRMEAKLQSAPMQMLYSVSGQREKDEQRLVSLDLREQELDDELTNGVSEFQKTQENEGLRFAEVIEFYRNEGELTIERQSSERSHSNEHTQTTSIQRTEGRDGR